MDIATGTPFNPNDGNPSHTVTWSGGEGVNLVVVNESFQNCYMKFSGGQIAYCPANDRRQFTLVGEMAQAQNQAVFTTQSQINANNTVNQVIVEVYAPGEEVPETYPAPLIRQANVAGQITASTLLLEDAAPLLTQVIKAVDTNTGLEYIDFIGPQLTLGSYQTGGFTGKIVLLEGGSGSFTSPSLSLFPTDITLQTRISDNVVPLTLTDSISNIYFAVDNVTTPNFTKLLLGNATIPADVRLFMSVPGGGSFINIVGGKYTSNAGNPTFNAPTAANFLDLQNNNVSVLQIHNDGAHIEPVSKLIWDAAAGIISNGISRISYFTASLTTTSSLFNHGLGVVPDMVIGINRGTGSTANPMKYNPGTSTSTQAALVASNAGTFDCLAIKF